MPLLAALAAAGAICAAALLYAIEHDVSVWQVLRETLRRAPELLERHVSLSDDELEEVLRELLPPRDAIEAGVRNASKAGGQPRAGSSQTTATSSPPLSSPADIVDEQLALTPTVVLALDGVCLEVTHDPQVGAWRGFPRTSPSSDRVHAQGCSGFK